MPSFIRPAMVLATGALLVGAMPASALAHSGDAAHWKFSNRTSHKLRGRSHLVAYSLRSRADGRSIRALLRGGLLLAPGAGYGSARGSAVVGALQLRLVRVGDRPGPIDGRYGPLTAQAVRRFQAAHGLIVDGIAGPVTLEALTSPTPVLYPGAGYGQQRGSASVRALQRALRGLGFSAGPLDGRYGPQTIRAVEHFQRAHGLQPDGVLGTHTGRALSAIERHRVALKRSRRPPRREHRPARSGARARPAPRHHSPVRPAGNVVRAPTLPVTLLLLGIAMMALGVVAFSYERRRARARRSGASDAWSAIGVPASAPDSRESNGSPAATSGEKERPSPVGSSGERERS